MFLPLTVATLGSFAALAAWARARRMKRIREQLQKPIADLPPDLEASWKQHRVWKFATEHSVILGTGAFTTGQALYHLSRIDGQVLDAIDTIYQPGVENSFPELVAHLRDLDGASEGAWTGGLAAYKGRLGEDYMAEYLESAGHHVELVASTNQAGWDAIVDGQMVNFKAGTDASHIQEHLENYPNIPVITVAEQGAHFADNDMVTCLTGVSGEQIEQTTEAAMESVVDATDLALDIPMVTLVLATAKNFKPLLDGHSTLGTATVNTATDTAGVGLGAAGGAKAGAMVGAFGGPIGMTAGAILGGIAGAMGGRLVAKGFKEKKLRAAMADYEQSVTNYTEAYLMGLDSKASSLRKTARSYERPQTLRSLLWPSPSDLLANELKDLHANWAEQCEERARGIRNRAETGVFSLNKFGHVLLKNGSTEAAYHPRLQQALTRIREAIQRVSDEQRSLGYAS